MTNRDRLTIEDEDGVEVVLPTRFEVCSGCDGKGTQDHPAFRNGITGDEFNGPDWDDDSRESYLSGAYDVPCEDCGGKRVQLVADEDRMSPELLAAWESHCDREARWAAEEASERRFGY